MFCLSFQEISFSGTKKARWQQLAIVFGTNIGSVLLFTPSLLHVVVRQQSNLTFVKVEHPTLKTNGSHAESLNLLRDIPFKAADDRLHLGRMV